MTATVTNERRVYSVSELKQLLGPSGPCEWTIYEEIKRHGHFAGVSPIRVGRRIMFPKAAIDRLLDGEESDAS